MYNSLRFFRYLVFGFFLICNAIIVTAAVWNLNLLQDARPPPSSLPLRTDAFLTFVGCAGLALILPILFCEVAFNGVFLVQVWFECIWVALFCIMELAGAASASAAGADELCGSLVLTRSPADRNAVCVSSRVLQAFSWICGLYLLFYFVVLFVTSLLKSKEDRTIWQCYAGRFPWMSAHQKITNVSPSQLESRKRPMSKRKSQGPPIIAAPRPRNAVNEAVRRAILSYRSGLSMDYTIEHFRPQEEAPIVEERPLPPPPVSLAPELPKATTKEAPVVNLSYSLYPQQVQRVMPVSPERQVQTRPPPPQQPPSPSPIGDWPRLNPPTPRPKRKSQRAGSSSVTLPPVNTLPPNSAQESRVARFSTPRTLPTFDFETPATAPVVPLPPSSYSASRTRPSGPRSSLEPLLTLLSLLTLSFAAWNVSSSQKTPAASGLIIFESCCFFVFAALAFIQVFRAKTIAARVAVECSWVGITALFQLGIAIGATVNSFVFFCRSASSADICASGALLVPSMWLKCLLSFGYFFSLFITAFGRREFSENIWAETVYTMMRLDSSIDRTIAKVDRDLEKAKAKSQAWDAESVDDENPYAGYLDDIESTSARKKKHSPQPSSASAPWAQSVPMKRGVDKPFSVTSAMPTPATTANSLPPTAPVPPLKIGGSQKTSSSRFIERFRESRILSRFELPSLYGSHFNSFSPPAATQAFPSTVFDHDQPIPKPRLSEWVRADDIRR
ncbi:hypothetical protein EST38_g6982 [Candolleomyces aberdarensis]|uniref:MARVEL domain-containing protein n=1 Tax=Candolleomyces aberdarensis TaxID=2316362 RepID=A0A4V1Q3K3_9AGAR|nr:hypothetical protein EST38_g6982 [Candolleomyces aberdarensis]